MTVSPSAATRNAVVFLAVIAGGAALLWMRGILTPLVLAMFLAVMIDSFARVLTAKAHFPKRVALPTAIVLLILLFGFSVWIVAENGAGFVNQLKAYAPRLNDVIARLAHAVGIQVAPTFGDLITQLNPQRYIGAAAQSLQNFGTSAVLVLIYLGFIIASRRGFSREMASMFPQSAERERAMVVFRRIRDSVEQYLWIQTVTGLMIAAAAWVVMTVLRLDNAFFWAFLIFLVSYIPILGGAIGGFLPPLFAVVQFPDTFAPAIILFLSLQAIHFVVGNIVLPRMQGDSLNMDPTVVLLSLAVWGAFWGLPGMFLSTPLTVACMVILAQFNGTRWIAILLSEDGDPKGASDSAADEPPSTERPTAKVSSAARRKVAKGDLKS